MISLRTSVAPRNAVAACWYRHRHELHHRHEAQPLLWALGWIARIAGGLGTVVILQRAESNGRLLLAMFGLLGGIMIHAALHTLGATLGGETSRLLLPLPLTPASRWRLMVLDALFATAGPALIMIISAMLTTSWQWAMVLACWIPGACSLGAAMACSCSWSLAGTRIRWRAMGILLGTTIVTGASLWMMATAPRPLSPLMLLPDAAILIGLSLGPGAGIVGRVIQPIQRQVATTPPTPFALAPRITARLANTLETYPGPAFAIVRKDLLTQSRDAFILVRIALIAAALPLTILLKPRFGDAPTSVTIASMAVILACYGMVELSPSPFGGEGNRLLLALQTGISPTSLMGGKVLGLLLFNLPQAWAVVTLASIGTRSGLLAWLFSLTAATVIVTGLCVVLTCASTSDIDLERHIEDRTQALMAEHMPIGARRMLGLGVTGLIAAGSIAILLQTPPGIALLLLCLFHLGSAMTMWKVGIRILTARHA